MRYKYRMPLLCTFLVLTLGLLAAHFWASVNHQRALTSREIPEYVHQELDEFENLRGQHGIGYFVEEGEKHMKFVPPIEAMEEFFNILHANNRELLALHLQGNRDPKVVEAFNEIQTLWFGVFGQQDFVEFRDAPAQEEGSE